MNATEKRVREISKHLSTFGRVAKKTVPKKKTLDFLKKYQVNVASPIQIKAPLAPTPITITAPLEKLDVETAVQEAIDKLLTFTPDMVKQLVQMMHALPENDKLEVSKGIRNASSFIYGGTKYGTHELMHGGSSSSGTTATFKIGEVVSGSGTAWTLQNVPTSGTLALFANGQRLTVTVDYSISSASITTVLSWDAGTILADYQM